MSKYILIDQDDYTNALHRLDNLTAYINVQKSIERKPKLFAIIFDIKRTFWEIVKDCPVGCSGCQKDKEGDRMAQIKELSEVLDGMAVVAKTAGKVFADDKVSLGDARFALDLVKEKDVLIEAFKGVDDIDDEIKDLDAEEAKQVLEKVFAIVKAFKQGKAEG